MARLHNFLIILLLVSLSLAVSAEDKVVFVDVAGGDYPALYAAIESANAQPVGTTTVIRVTYTGINCAITTPINGSDTAFPLISSHIILKALGVPENEHIGIHRADSASSKFRALSVGDGGQLEIDGPFAFANYWSEANGGIVSILGTGSYISKDVLYRDSSANNGGGIFRDGSGDVHLAHNTFKGLHAELNGGALSIRGISEALASIFIYSNTFYGNDAGVFGGFFELDVIADEFEAALSCSNVIVDEDDGPAGEFPSGFLWSVNDIWSSPGRTIDNTGTVNLSHTIIGATYPDPMQLKSSNSDNSKLMAKCEDFGTNSFVSHGYNIVSDGSCGLNQATDSPNTDPLIVFDANGMPTLLPGSPAIDGGSAEIWQPVPGFQHLLPCGHVDIAGNARPQDANGDGIFECDIGPVEVQGAGQAGSVHSAAFFNTLRNGEGTFVEVFENGLAVIYTFSYTPDGSEPAWMVTVGHLVGNAIISDGLIITTGTRFGENFVAADVVRNTIGEMSMVFPDCATSNNAGSVAYTGSLTQGYEALLTRSTRLTSIIDCDGTKSANSGRSGSFFDPNRDGEGIIVQWLSDGRVQIMFFTYGLDGGQMWIFGVGEPNGATVTVNANYPTGLTQWGSGFTSGDVVLTPWGSMTLTYTDCNTLTFSYNSTVAGFGSGTRTYQRLTKLKDTACT